MAQSAIFEKVREAFVEALGVDDDEVLPESKIFDEQCQKLYAVASYDWYPVAFQNPRNQQQPLGVAVEIDGIFQIA